MAARLTTVSLDYNHFDLPAAVADAVGNNVEIVANTISDTVGDTSEDTVGDTTEDTVGTKDTHGLARLHQF